MKNNGEAANAICPVCGTGCDCYAKQCDSCGFADNLGVNPLWADAEDAREWHKAVVKPLRMEWEIRELRKASAEALKYIISSSTYIKSLESRVNVLEETFEEAIEELEEIFEKQRSCNENHEHAIAQLQKKLEQTAEVKGESPPRQKIRLPDRLPPERPRIQLQIRDPLIGSVIPLGEYKWRVLDIQKGQALLLSEFVLGKRPYHNQAEDITWEKCTLRHYLNNNCYNKLPANDRGRIAKKVIANYDNPEFATIGGNITSDRIFLLSVEEMREYLGDVSINVNSKRIAKDMTGGACWWWLRSPGNSGIRATFVSDGGYVFLGGTYVSAASGGVRPALWLNL